MRNVCERVCVSMCVCVCVMIHITTESRSREMSGGPHRRSTRGLLHRPTRRGVGSGSGIADCVRRVLWHMAVLCKCKALALGSQNSTLISDQRRV